MVVRPASRSAIHLAQSVVWTTVAVKDFCASLMIRLETPMAQGNAPRLLVQMVSVANHALGMHSKSVQMCQTVQGKQLAVPKLAMPSASLSAAILPRRCCTDLTSATISRAATVRASSHCLTLIQISWVVLAVVALQATALRILERKSWCRLDCSKAPIFVPCSMLSLVGGVRGRLQPHRCNNCAER